MYRASLKAILVTLTLTTGACGGGSGGKDMAAFVGVWSADRRHDDRAAAPALRTAAP